MSLTIATWNINGVKARLETALAYLEQAAPDVICLQEIKSVDAQFPADAFERLGYQVETHGQKSFNGVALLSKLPIEIVHRGLPGNEGDEQARYIEGIVEHENGSVRVGGLYLPNGNSVDSEKYPYKLAWMEHLIAHAQTCLALEEPFLLAGDYNVIPEPIDAARPEVWTEDALFLPQTRSAYRRLRALGLQDAVRSATDAQQFTFWDYQAGAWQKNNGIRIDHILMSPELSDDLVDCGIDAFVRGWEKPSDHVPVWARFRTA